MKRAWTLIVFAAILLWLFGAYLVFAQDGQGTCNNFFSTPKAQHCACHKAMSCDPKKGEDPKCKQHCFPSHCHCVAPCSTKIEHWLKVWRLYVA
jgi:hypothetical protein